MGLLHIFNLKKQTNKKNPPVYLAARCLSSIWDLVPWPEVKNQAPCIGSMES